MTRKNRIRNKAADWYANGNSSKLTKVMTRLHVLHDYELQIFHNDRVFAHEGPDDCTAWIVETLPDAIACKAIASFEAILNTLEHKLGIPDSSLVRVMDDYVRFGCSSLRLKTTPAKLHDAGLLVIH
ncbi:hypothetical protein [Terriglobus albidus]|uniref:hypothetical protein n=1 Tax=Terriglobus albidus TaxID=1592106 RepID=UPI0021DFEDD4|nr:hypothetical protein [Terriglobus albidus]